ncbi:MAG: hypothetical protein HQL22_12820, partial [Candidatus Omnitrophica bacterium]|nr:hypothetical protein [Candidatus Omnitrophota bacterium]
LEKDIDQDKYKGKQVIVLSAGEAGANPSEANVRLWHYKFSISGTYGDNQAQARANRLNNKVEDLKIRRAIGMEYKRFINVDAVYQDSRLSTAMRDSLRTMKGRFDAASEAEKPGIQQEINRAVEQIMDILEHQERQQTMTQAVSVSREVNRDAFRLQQEIMEQDFVKDLAGTYKGADGWAKMLYGVQGDGYRLVKAEGDQPVMGALVAAANGTGIMDQYGNITLEKGQFGVEQLSGTMLVFNNGSAAGQEDLLTQYREKNAVPVSIQAVLIKTDIANPDSAPDAPATVKTFVRADRSANTEKIADAEGNVPNFVLNLTRALPVFNAQGVRVGVQQVTHVYKADALGSTKDFLKIIGHPTVDQPSGIDFAPLKAMPENHTVQGYAYQAIKDAQGKVAAVIFEGAIHQVDANGRFQARIGEDAKTSDMRDEQLKLKLDIQVNDNATVEIKEAHVMNEASLLLGNTQFKKGDRVNVYMEDGKKMFAVSGRGAVVAAGVIYDRQSDGSLRIDKADIEVSFGGKTYRVAGYETRPSEALDQKYSRGKIEITHGLEGVQGLPRKMIIDLTTGQLLSKGDDEADGSSVERPIDGLFWNNTVYLPGENGKIVVDGGDQILAWARALKVEVVKENDSRHLIDYQQFKASAFADNERMSDFQRGQDAMVKTGGKDRAVVMALAQKVPGLGRGVKAEVVAFAEGGQVMVVLDSPHAVSYGIRIVADENDQDSFAAKQIRFVRKNFNKDIVFNPALDEAHSAALSTSEALFFGSALGLSFLKGSVEFNEAAVFLHELVHEWKKKQIGEGTAGLFDQSRFHNLKPWLKLFGTGKHIYNEQFSPEEVLAHYFEMFGLEFDKTSGDPIIPPALLDFAGEKVDGFKAMLKEAREALPAAAFKGKYQFMQESYAKSDKRAADREAQAMATILERSVDFAQKS